MGRESNGSDIYILKSERGLDYDKNILRRRGGDMNNKSRSAFYRTITCLILMLAVTRPACAIAIDIYPNFNSVPVGQVIRLDIVITGLGSGNAPSLSAFDVGMTYEPSHAEFTEIAFGNNGVDQLDLMGFGSITYVDDSYPGQVYFGEISFDDPSYLNNWQQDSFILASLDFYVASIGIIQFSLRDVTLIDAFGGALGLDNDPGIVEVTATAVPLPSVGWLMISGVLLLATCVRAHTQ